MEHINNYNNNIMEHLKEYLDKDTMGEVMKYSNDMDTEGLLEIYEEIKEQIQIFNTKYESVSRVIIGDYELDLKLGSYCDTEGLLYKIGYMFINRQNRTDNFKYYSRLVVVLYKFLKEDYGLITSEIIKIISLFCSEGMDENKLIKYNLNDKVNDIFENIEGYEYYNEKNGYIDTNGILGRCDFDYGDFSDYWSSDSDNDSDSDSD